MTRRSSRQVGRGEAGLTLLELLISMTILAFMMIIAWSTIVQTMHTRKAMEDIQQRYRGIRVALTHLERDITMAYLSANDDPQAPDRRTMFIGNKQDGGRLIFSSFAHQRFFAEAAESDQTVLAYFLAEDPDHQGQRNLYRYESARLESQRWDQIPGETEPLLEGVSKFELAFWDPRAADWVDEWDTTKVDYQGKLPTRVRIQIGFKDEHDREEVFTTQAFIPMQEVLQSYAN